MEGSFETIISIILLVLPVVVSFIVFYKLVTPLIKSVRTAYVVEYTDIYAYTLFNNPPYPTIVDVKTSETPNIIDTPSEMAYKRFFESGGIGYYEYYGFTYKDRVYYTHPNYYYVSDLLTINNYVYLSQHYGLQYLKHRFGLLGSSFTVYSEYIGPSLLYGSNTRVEDYSYEISKYISRSNSNKRNVGSEIDNLIKNTFLHPPIVMYSPIRTHAIKYNLDEVDVTEYLINYAYGLPSQSDLDGNVYISGIFRDGAIYNNFIFGTGGTLVLDYGKTIMTSYLATISVYNRFAFKELKGYPINARIRVSLSTINGLTNIDPTTESIVNMRVYVTHTSTLDPRGIPIPYIVNIKLSGIKKELQIAKDAGLPSNTKLCVPITSDVYNTNNGNNNEKCEYEEDLMYGESDLMLTIALDEYIPDMTRYFPEEINVMITLFDGITKTYTIRLDTLRNQYVKSITIPISLKDIMYNNDQSVKWEEFYLLISQYNYNIPIKVNVMYKYMYDGREHYVSVDRSFTYVPKPIAKVDTADELVIVSTFRSIARYAKVGLSYITG